VKKFLIVLCLVLAINLFGCSNQNNNSSSSLLQSTTADANSNVTSDSIISPSSTITDELESDSSDNGEEKFKEQLSSFQEDLASQRGEFEKNDTGNYSSSDEAIWQYCQDRWKYYDNLEGGYSGDKHTKDVFNDAASQFGISASEAESIWDSVDQAKVGLK
jgi:hypothetical protein